MEVHPLADMVPEMTNEEFTELVEDIQTNGLVQPIITFGGKILDGRHRFKACEKAGVTPTFTEYKGDAPAALVLSLNCKRRSLTQAQRSLLAADMFPELEKERKGRNQHTEPVGDSSTSTKEARTSRTAAAKAAGVGSTSVQQAKKLTTAAASGDVKAQKAVADVKSGKTTTIGRAATQAGLTAKKTKAQFPKATEKAANGERSAGTTAIDGVSLLLKVDSDTDKAKDLILGLLAAFAGQNIDQETRNVTIMALDELIETIQTVKSQVASPTNFDDLLK